MITREQIDTLADCITVLKTSLDATARSDAIIQAQYVIAALRAAEPAPSGALVVGDAFDFWWKGQDTKGLSVACKWAAWNAWKASAERLAAEPAPEVAEVVKRLYSLRGKIVDGLASEAELLDTLADAAALLSSASGAVPAATGGESSIAALELGALWDGWIPSDPASAIQSLLGKLSDEDKRAFNWLAHGFRQVGANWAEARLSRAGQGVVVSEEVLATAREYAGDNRMPYPDSEPIKWAAWNMANALERLDAELRGR
jgi:hypothetical protein